MNFPGIFNLAGVGEEAEGLNPQQLVNEGLVDPQQGLMLGGLLGLDAPVDPGSNFREYMSKQDGAKGFFGAALNPLLSKMIFSDDYDQFASDKASYAGRKAQFDMLSDVMKDQLTQDFTDVRVNNAIAGLNDGEETPEDAYHRAYLTKHLGDIGKVGYALTGDTPGVKPEYVQTTNNGQVYMIDKNNPTAPGIPLTTPDGQPIRGKLDQWQVDNIGAFDRMAPRLQELDEMEQNGVAIPRSTMSMLRNYETRDAEGRNILSTLGWQNWVEENLTPEQRQYILAAEDAGMVVLRDESGAAISSNEILRQLNQYIMFDDLDDDTFTAQRNARNRKAKSLLTGAPDYIKEQEGRAQNLQWVNDFSGERRPPPPESTDRYTDTSSLAPSTSAPVPFKPAPQGAVDKLRQNPAMAEAFKTKYGYLPEGI